MESEWILEKLRRLRYQSDYPLRLFLAAIGGPWHSPAGPCPFCGRREREARGGRSEG